MEMKKINIKWLINMKIYCVLQFPRACIACTVCAPCAASKYIDDKTWIAYTIQLEVM